ncbi:MAG: hypothetical protein KF803_10360 [Cyclobacteriaceae bacterium]|nr:hypothetical protein [Cyclobacteriaceae bacterium]
MLNWFHLDDLYQRVKLIKVSVLIAFVIGILFSQKLWLNTGRLLPNLELFDSMPILSYQFDRILLLLFVVAGLIWVFSERRIIGWITIIALIIMLLQDQMRWQPWVYLYLLMLIPFLFISNRNIDRIAILTTLQWIIAGVYFWSGVHKLNQSFLDITFSQMTNVLGLNGNTHSWKKLGYIIPIIELSMGLTLLIPRFRRVGLYTAILTHIIILFYLSPVALNHNSVVYPWNVAMIVLLYLLFGDRPQKIPVTVSKVNFNLLKLVPVLFVWVFPIFNFFGYWDHYLSFSLYSDKTPKFYIAIEANEIHKIDKRFENYFAKIEGLQGGQIIDVDKWAYSELNVPFYPEMRLFRKLSSNFCRLDIDDNKLLFLELVRSNNKSHYAKFNCH